MTRLTVISHSCVLRENQRLWAEAAQQPEVELTLIAPSRWNSPLHGPLEFAALPELERNALPLRVYWPGRPHLHTYSDLGPQMTKSLPDVVYLDEDPHSLVAAQVLSIQAIMGFRLIITLKQNILKHYPLPFSWIEKRSYRLAAGATATSTECLDVARAKGFHRPTEIIGYPIDTRVFRPNGNTTDPGHLRLGFAGRLVPEKGVSDLIEAVAIAQRQAPVQLAIMGTGPERAALEEQAHRQLQPGSCVFWDHLPPESMPEWYHSLDVVVLPSLTTKGWKEQFGRVLAEALACQVPVIGSDSGFIPDLVESTGGGLTYPEGDVATLAEAVVTMAHDTALREQLGRQGRAGVERDYSLPAVVAKIMRLVSPE